MDRVKIHESSSPLLSLRGECEKCHCTSRINDYGYCDDCEAKYVPRNKYGEIEPRAYILILARSFPCLRGKVAHLTADTWDVDKFIEASGPWSTGETLAALFVANVWNHAYAKDQGWGFDLMRFIANADNGNRRALINWLSNPVWP